MNVECFGHNDGIDRLYGIVIGHCRSNLVQLLHNNGYTIGR